MSKSSNYTDMLLEDINSKFDAVLEMVAPLVGLRQEIRELREDVEEIKSDMSVIKGVARDHSSWLQKHEVRLSTIEHTAFR